MAYFARPRPRVFGHRGAAGLAPENTIPSFGLAMGFGVGYLELDVHATKDHIIVVLHDATVDRTTDGTGPVSSFTYAELEHLDAGYQFTYDGRHFPYRGQGIRIPTLESVLRTFPDCPLNVEIKQRKPSIIDGVIRVLSRCRAEERVLLAAGDDAIMLTIRSAVENRIATSMSAGEVADFIGRCNTKEWSGYAPAAKAMQIPPAYNGIELVTPINVLTAHGLGLEVHVWTINDRAEIDRLLDIGVDGIMSDLPGLITEAIAARGPRD